MLSAKPRASRLPSLNESFPARVEREREREISLSTLEIQKASDYLLIAP